MGILGCLVLRQYLNRLGKEPALRKNTPNIAVGTAGTAGILNLSGRSSANARRMTFMPVAELTSVALVRRYTLPVQYKQIVHLPWSQSPHAMS